MWVDIFSRIYFLLSSSFTPGPIDPSPTQPLALPTNLSLTNSFADWLNGTVVIENPSFQYGTEENDESYFYEPITLPMCCGHIDPAGNKSVLRSGYCSPVEDDDWQKSNDYDYTQLDIISSRRLINHAWYPAGHIFPSENRSLYRFEVRKPSCSGPLKTVKLSLDDFEVGKQGRFLRNGYFGYNNDEFYSPREYCISGLTGEFVQVMICDSPGCSWAEGRPCIQKCCNPDEIYSFSRRECIKSKGALFRPIFYHDLSHKLSDSQQESVHPHYHIVFPRSFKYHCEENKTQIFPAGADFAHHLSNFTNRKYYSAHFKIRQDGKIMYRKDGKAIVLPEGYPIYLQDNSKKCYTLQSTSHYCIDGAAEYGRENPFNNDEGEIFFVTCSEYLLEPPKIGPLSFLYGNVMIGSSLFSLLTVVVYVIVKDKRNTAGWNIASYAFSMFLMYIFLGLAHLIRYYRSDEVLKTASCVIVGIASHLFSLTSFLWLTSMNFHLFWTFRKLRPSFGTTKGGGNRQRIELRHFLTYSMVGWGVPILITGVSTFIHFKYEEASEDDCAVVDVPLPAYGRESCEIKQLSLGVYLYYPATFLLACNLLFFIVTSYRLCRLSRQTQLATKNLERHHQSVQLFAKLFFVMGVTRVFEVITWAESGPTLTWYWAVFDIFNVLQAVAIFIIFVCKRDVLESLKKLYYRMFNSDQKRKGRNHRERITTCVTLTQQLDEQCSTLLAPVVVDASVTVPVWIATTMKPTMIYEEENSQS